jgi:hypothetical protein
MVPFVPVPNLNSEDPVDDIVNVLLVVMVVPPIFGAVVCPVQFHVKLLKVTPVIPAPNHEPAVGFVNPIIEQTDPLFQVAMGIPRPERETPDIGALHS